MRQTLTCSFCKNVFDGPAAVCPRCGGPIAEGGGERVERAAAVYPTANDDGIAIDLGDDEGEMVIVPVGVDDATLFTPPATKPAPAKPRPPPLPKKIASA